MKTVRLNKFISECGFASRRKSEEFILDGRVTVNGEIVNSLSVKVDPFNDDITIDGERILKKRKVYYLLNKPKGYITSTNDEKNRKTVIDLIKTKDKIYPVGRLDYDTTGVLFLTNDGYFTNFLTHPRNKVPREYYAVLDYPLEEEDKLKLIKGIVLDGKKGKFAKVNFSSNANKSRVLVTAIEGRNRFVKRMFKVLGYNVQSLDRKSYAGVTAANLPMGAYRKMSFSEITQIVKKFS